MGDNVTFASNGETAQAYLATPPRGSGPALVLIQEWWGLVPHIVDVADRLAAEGFVVLAPDLFRGVVTREPDEAAKLMMALDLERAAKDIAGAAASLRTRDDTTGAGVGVVGFCMGGGLALWSGTISPDIAATVAFYPAMPWEGLSPDWSAYAGKHALVHLAEQTKPRIEQVSKEIESAGGSAEYDDYPGVHHAFFNDARPEVYDAEAAKTAWQRTLEFLRRHLA